MTECAIFVAAGLIEATWHEVDRLCESVVEGLRGRGLQKSSEYDEDGDGTSYARVFGIRRAKKPQGAPAQLLLGFDLYRSGEQSTWEPGTAAMLLIAYAPSLANGWEFEDLKFSRDGMFTDVEVSAKLRPVGNSEGRLLIWNGDGAGGQYGRLNWLYGVPLQGLPNPEAVERNLVAPIASLLEGGPTALTPLLSSDAVKWPSAHQP